LSRTTLGAALVAFPLVLFPVYQLSVLALRACRSSRSMPKDASRDEVLPFPGEYGPNGFATQYINLCVEPDICIDYDRLDMACAEDRSRMPC
jgi:hypothetical protein